MDLTSELVALCERPVADPGIDPNWTTEVRLRELSDSLVAQRPDGPFWIFAYGSLIWNPTFESVARKRGTARGWHRSFCLDLDNWRATPELHGLMMALDHGGTCDGLLLQVAEAGLDDTVYGLVWREISFEQDFGSARWLSVATADGPVKALAFGLGLRASACCAGCRPRKWLKSSPAPAAIWAPMPPISTIPYSISRKPVSTIAISGTCRNWWRRKSRRSMA